MVDGMVSARPWGRGVLLSIHKYCCSYIVVHGGTRQAEGRGYDLCQFLVRRVPAVLCVWILGVDRSSAALATSV